MGAHGGHGLGAHRARGRGGHARARHRPGQPGRQRGLGPQGRDGQALQVVAQVGPEVLGRGVALGRVLGHELGHDGLEGGRDGDPAGAGQRGGLLHVLVGDGHRGVAGEGRPGGEHLVEHAAERVQVAAGIDRPALGLLGGEVGGGAHDRAGLGQVGLGAPGDGLGDAEVGHLHLTARRDQDVARLDVAVHHPVAVGEAERGGHVCGDLRRPPGVQRTLGAHDLRQAAALHVLHDDEVGARLLAPVVDGHHVGVVEVGGRLGLAAEPLHEGRVLGVLGEEHLDRHGSVQQQVAGQVDVGHPPAPGAGASRSGR